MQHHLVTRQSSWLPTNALQTEAMCLLACLWITAPRCLRLHLVFLLVLCHLLPASHISHSDCRFRSSPLYLAIKLFCLLSHLCPSIAFGFHFLFSAFPPQQPSLSVSSLSRSRWDPAARMTSPADERRCSYSVTWMRGSKCWPIIHHNIKRNSSN